MAITLRLTKRTDPDWVQELTYQEDSITVGRDASNVLQLASPLVSKLHARIEPGGEEYRVVDLKSRNGTFLNDEKLVEGRVSPFRVGDRLRVSDFILECVSAEIIPPRPAVAVEQFDALASRLQAAEKECARLMEENRHLQEQLASGYTPEPKPQVPVSSGVDSDTVQQLRKVAHALLGGFLKLMTGRFSFRSEFLGMTVIQDARLSALYSNSPDEALRYLLDPGLSAADVDVRLKMLEGELHDVRLHVMGLLDGYRKSVDEGTRKLLQGMNPEVLRKELSESTIALAGLRIPYRFLPGIFELKLAQLVQRRQREFMEEDRGILEKRFFRPAFIQAYQSCVTSFRI